MTDIPDLDQFDEAADDAGPLDGVAPLVTQTTTEEIEDDSPRGYVQAKLAQCRRALDTHRENRRSINAQIKTLVEEEAMLVRMQNAARPRKPKS